MRPLLTAAALLVGLVIGSHLPLYTQIFDQAPIDIPIAPSVLLALAMGTAGLCWWPDALGTSWRRTDPGASRMPVFLRYAVPSACVVGGWLFAVLDSNVTCTADGRERLTLDPTVLSTVDIADAAAEQTTTGYAIRLEFTAEGQRRWEDVTREKVGQFIAFLVDDELLAAPQITQPLTGDSAQLPGPFTSLDQARKVADAIRGN